MPATEHFKAAATILCARISSSQHVFDMMCVFLFFFLIVCGILWTKTHKQIDVEVGYSTSAEMTAQRELIRENSTKWKNNVLKGVWRVTLRANGVVQHWYYHQSEPFVGAVYCVSKRQGIDWGRQRNT